MQGKVPNAKGNVLEHGRVFAVWFELCNLALLELTRKAFIVGPEESNVGNFKQNHGKALQSQTKGPTTAIRSSSHVQDLQTADKFKKEFENGEQISQNHKTLPHHFTLTSS